MLRRTIFVFLGLVVLLAVFGGWATWRALQARTDLTAAQSTLSAVRADLREGRVDEALQALPALRERLDRAASRTGGLSTSVAVHLPVLGRHLRAVRNVADAGRLLGDRALPKLVDALDIVRRQHPVRAGVVDLTLLARIGDDVRAAAEATAQARKTLNTDNGPLLAQVRTKLDEVRAKVDGLDDGLQRAVKAFAIAPSMLGADGPRTYFVAVQNNAEARATGGLIGAFALIRTDRGRIDLQRTGTDGDFQVSDTPAVILPGAAKTWQDIGSTRAWFDTNLTPHFPDAAQAMAGLWHRQGGALVDGVLSVDPLVMSELLRASGPVQLGGATVSADNVVDFVGHQEYVAFPDNEVRKKLLAALAEKVFHQVVAGADSSATAKGLLKAAGSGHLFLWSRHDPEQQVLSGGLVGGALPSDAKPYLSVLTQNYGGDKLDFYLRRTVSVTRVAGRLKVRIVLTNTAPLGLPLYMTVRSDRPQPPVPYGQAKVGVAVYGAQGSKVTEVTVNGAATFLLPDTDHGHFLGTTSVEVPRERPVTIELLLTEPAGELRYRQQPLVAADELAIDVPHRVLGR